MRKTFDDIIRRRWEGQQFPVDEVHRQQMIELLEGKKKRRAFAFWWWGAGAIVLVAGYLLWQNSNITTQPQANEAVEHTDPVPASSSNTNTETPNTHGTADNNPVEITNTNDRSFQQTGDDLQLNGINNSTNSTLRSAKTTLNKPASTSNKRTDTNQNRQPGFTLQSTATTSTSSSVIGNEGVVVTERAKQDVPGDPDSTIGNTLLNSSGTNGGNAIASDIEAEIPQPTRTMLSIAWLDALPIEALPVNADHEVGSIKPASKVKHPLYAFAEAGAGVILGSQPKYPAGWKMNAGAGIGYLLQPKLHLMVSGGYLVQDGGFDFERTSTVSSLGFGVRSQINSLKPDRLHYVYGKLGLQYRIKKHHIGGSAEMQWLYGAQGSISIHTADQVTGSSESTSYAWLNLNGLNRFHYNAGVQYGYRLTPHLNVAAGTQFYFTALTKQDPALLAEGYNWKGNTAKVQPFITFNYLLYGPF